MRLSWRLRLNYSEYSDLVVDDSAENYKMVWIVRPQDLHTDLNNLSGKALNQRQRGSVLVQYSCLNSATPLELWWSVGWVHLSGSSSWQNTFRQHSSTAGECDLMCCDRQTQNCTSAWVTLHSQAVTPETVGATVGPQCNKIPRTGNARLLVLFSLKAHSLLQTVFMWACMFLSRVITHICTHTTARPAVSCHFPPPPHVVLAAAGANHDIVPLCFLLACCWVHHWNMKPTLKEPIRISKRVSNKYYVLQSTAWGEKIEKQLATTRLDQSKFYYFIHHFSLFILKRENVAFIFTPL